MYQGDKGRLNYQQGKGSANIRPDIDFSEQKQFADRMERQIGKRDEKKAAAQKKQQKMRDDALDFGKMPTPGERDAKAIAERAKEVSDWIIEKDKEGTLGSTENQLLLRQKKQDIIDASERSMQEYERYTDDLVDYTKANNSEFFNKKEVIDARNAEYWGPEHERNIFSDSKDYEKTNPYGTLDKGAFLEKYISSLDPSTQTYEYAAMENGEQIFKKATVSGNFIKMENGKVALDENNEPILHVSDAQAERLMMNKRWVREMEELLEDDENEFETVKSLTKKELMKYHTIDEEKSEISKGFARDKSGAKKEELEGREDRPYIFHILA